jgi:hypothetical protein
MSIAGHVSPKMLAHYSHVRIQAKRTALDALATGRTDTRTEKPVLGTKAEGYDTNNDTKQPVPGEEVPQIVENMVELVGIELLRVLKTGKLLIFRESYNAQNA